MLPSKLSRAAHRATTTTSISVSGSTAALTATCNACLHVSKNATSRRTHQRRDSSSKTSSSSSSSSAERCSSSSGSKAASSVAKSGVTSSSTTPKELKEGTVKDLHVEEKVAKSAKAISSTESKGRVRPSRRGGNGMTQDGTASKKSTSTGVQQSEDVRLRDHFAGLPSVPSVQGLSESELSLSTFFSLHRPLAPHNPFPAPTDPKDFHKLFTPSKPAEDPWANGNSAERRPEDVTFTLHSMVEQLDNAIESVENAAREGVKLKRIVVRQEGAAEGGVRHLDPRQQGQQRGGMDKLQAVLNPAVRGQVRPKSLEELQAMFKPFRIPPPPEPMPDEPKPRTRGGDKTTSTTRAGAESIAADSEGDNAEIVLAEGEEAAQLQNLTSSEPQQKTFTTTITVTESTYANGRKTYSASSSPIVAATLSSSALEEAQTTTSELVGAEYVRPMTRRERIRTQRLSSASTPAVDAAVGVNIRVPLGQRGQRVRQTSKAMMFLISVKRQRKLKMKKHKYKKLMKRTRTLRRKLERT